MKKKGAGMMMTIILVAVCGWVAIVGLVIKPDMVTGAFLSVAGGGIIGLIIAYLIRRWWFKGIPAIMKPNVKKVTSHKKYSLGTRYQTGRYNCRYACAGEDLKANTLVEAGLSARLVLGEPLPQGQEISDLTYGDVKAVPEVNKHTFGILGWPMVDVRKYQYFWLSEMPLGAELKKEEGNVA